MKPINNRQNKTIQTHRPSVKGVFVPLTARSYDNDYIPVKTGGIILGLVSDLFFATKIAQAAKHCHVLVHNFDKAQPLLKHLKEKHPHVVILDWDGCEAEAFKVLQALRAEDALKGIATVGYLSLPAKADLKQDAEHAGCHRVYSKTEFLKNLENLVIRYTQ